MSDEHSNEGTPPGNIFGKLPNSRPGTRSPRRRTTESAEAKGEPAKASSAAKSRSAKAAVKAKEAAATPKPRATTAAAGGGGRATPAKPAGSAGAAARPAGDAEQQGSGGLEDIAWAGVAAAAEAATIGVRLASRAIDALRGSTERR